MQAKINKLKALLEKDDVDVDAGNALLGDLKLEVMNLSLSGEAEKLAVARDILETATLFSVKAGDFEGFERTYSQLNAYSPDRVGTASESPQRYLITGLYLLYLLTQNRMSEFHSELELLPTSLHTDNEFIRHSVRIEQSISEGSYLTVLKGSKQVPHLSYNIFMSDILNTIRDKIAQCAEKAYGSLTVESAQKVLLFDTEAEVLEYMKEREWKVEMGTVDFTPEEESKDVNANQLIDESLSYAKQLETIV